MDRRKKPLIFTALNMEAKELVALGLSPLVIGVSACKLPKDLRAGGPSCIIMAGIAGALDPSLKIGDIVLDDSHGLVPPGTQIALHRGAIHTADQCVCTIAQKAALFRETRALAVEMEHAIVRRAAGLAGIPVIGIRAISDTADHAIDPAVFRLADDVGNPRPKEIAKLLIRRPQIVGHLRQLDRQSKQAAKSMAAAVKWIVDSITPPLTAR